jgi:eukaryotic-like serine/threonine-protein kinase
MGLLPDLGSVVGEKFHIDYEIRSGPMGTIFGATNQRIGRPVVLKFLNPVLAMNIEWCERFQNEARAAALLTSEHVVEIYDVGLLENGLPYIVMEWLSGRGLDEIIAQTGAQTTEESVGYLLQACHAIGQAHSCGIVHRDLKPENLFLDERNSEKPIVKVLDFGIAKLLLDWALKARLTQPGKMLGTPPYMAPEQWKDCATVDHRVDIWSLGIILFELLTGQQPFQTTGVTNLINLRAMIETAQVTPPGELVREVPTELSAAVLKCLRKHPDDRFQSVAELAEAIARFGPEDSQRLVNSTKAFLSGSPRSLETPSERFSIRPMTRPVAPHPTDASAYVGASDESAKEWCELIRYKTQSFLVKAVAHRFRIQRKVTFVLGQHSRLPTAISLASPLRKE